ncbi:MAG: WD40/YVTN/BNR-like repeat-containing protein [Candidatus Acidiferrales bacterium]
MKPNRTDQAFSPLCAMRFLLFAGIMLSSVCSGSAQWILQESHSTANLRGIHNLGGGIAWASGSNGAVLRTTDDGAHWQKCATPPGADELDFRGIQAFDKDTAIVMSSGQGNLSRLYKTADGCQTWKLTFTNPDADGFWDAIQFTSRDYQRIPGKCFGVVLGDPVANHFSLFLTFDCGENWERQKTLPKALPGEAAFAASNSGLFLGGFADRSFVTGGPSGARQMSFRTFVGDVVLEGQRATNSSFSQINKWNSSKLPEAHPSNSAGAFSMGWAEGHGPVVVGGDYEHPDRRDDSAWYWDAGPNDSRYEFKLAKTPPHGFRSAVAYEVNTRTWITVGPNGTDISPDYGRNWHPLGPDPKKGDAPDADRNWNALSLPFVVGPNGRIGKLRTNALDR